jgi:hypothetical protein
MLLTVRLNAPCNVRLLTRFMYVYVYALRACVVIAE